MWKKNVCIYLFFYDLQTFLQTGLRGTVNIQEQIRYNVQCNFWVFDKLSHYFLWNIYNAEVNLVKSHILNPNKGRKLNPGPFFFTAANEEGSSFSATLWLGRRGMAVKEQMDLVFFLVDWLKYVIIRYTHHADGRFF